MFTNPTTTKRQPGVAPGIETIRQALVARSLGVTLFVGVTTQGEQSSLRVRRDVRRDVLGVSTINSSKFMISLDFYHL